MWPPSCKDQMPHPVLTREQIEKMPGIAPLAHAFLEILTIFGTNMDCPSDLGGEKEFWLEDEKFFLTRSFFAYFLIPQPTRSIPLKSHRINASLFHHTVGPARIT